MTAEYLEFIADLNLKTILRMRNLEAISMKVLFTLSLKDEEFVYPYPS